MKKYFTILILIVLFIPALVFSQSSDYGFGIRWLPGTFGAVYYNGGNVGIGTTDPDAALHIRNATGPQLIITNTDKADSCKFEVDGDGNLGITATGSIRVGGTGTPNGKFDVYSSAFTTHAISSTRNTGSVGGFEFWGTTTGTGLPFKYSDIITTIISSVDGAETGLLQLRTPNAGGTPATRMVINETGYVGIGTSDPDAALHVVNATGPQLIITDTNKADSVTAECDGNGDLIVTPSGGNTFLNGTINFAADGQADDDYEISLPGVTELTTGLMVVFTATTANTDGATLEITEVGDLDAILKMHDQALVTGDIKAGQVVVCVFDGTNWQMISQIAQ